MPRRKNQPASTPAELYDRWANFIKENGLSARWLTRAEERSQSFTPARSSKAPRRTGKKKGRKRTGAEVVADLLPAVDRSGARPIRVSRLLNLFGYKRRGAVNVAEVSQSLGKLGLHVYPPLSMELDPTSTVSLSRFPVAALGDLFEREDELEMFVWRNKYYERFGIVSGAKRQHSPDNTRDRFDMFGIGKDGEQIVLELKNTDGGREAVQQVFSYISVLKQNSPGSVVKGYLITGVRDIKTARCIHGMVLEGRPNLDSFAWYLYDCNRSKGTLEFVEVPYRDIEPYFR